MGVGCSMAWGMGAQSMGRHGGKAGWCICMGRRGMAILPGGGML